MATKEKVLTPWCNLIDKFTTKEKLHFPFMKLVLENILEQVFLEAQQTMIKDAIERMSQQMEKQIDNMKTWVYYVDSDHCEIV